MPPPSFAALKPEAVFHDRYCVVRRIKAGGMGAVFEVVDQTTNSRRALKVMLPDAIEDDDLRVRFALEARITGDIESDHIVRISDAGIDPATGMPFLVMDLLRGEELGSMMKRVGALSPAEVVVFLFQASLALDKAHAASIVHRDLKPANLFITTRDDGSPCVKILDFGIAKVAAQSAGHTTRPVGTPLYMAPEQLGTKGRIGPLADIYALGQVAYALLVGEPYWLEELSASETIFPLLAQINSGVPEAPSARAERRRRVSLSAAFDGWFFKATALDPAERFERASTAILALSEALGVSSPRTGSSPINPLEAPRIATEPSYPGYDSSPQTGRTGASVATVVSQPLSSPRRRALKPVLIALAVAASVILAGTFVLRPAFHVMTRTDAPAAVSHDALPPPSEAARAASLLPPVALTAPSSSAVTGAPSVTTAAATAATTATAAASTKPASPKQSAPGAKRKAPSSGEQPQSPRVMF